MEVLFLKKNMNKTKKLTQGAMMLAILGALIIIDRMTAYWFTTFVVLIAPIIIIMYSAMQSFKDGILLSIGVLIISFLLGNFQTTYLIYIPVGVVTGLAYSYGVIKGLDKSTLLFIACVTYAVGELLATYIIYPILGFPVAQMIEELKIAMDQAGGLSGFNYKDIFNAAGFELDKLLVIIYLISTVLTGAMEGVLIHIIVIFLLKRFKIKDLGRINIWDIKPNKVLSYTCMLTLLALFIITRKVQLSETFNYVSTFAFFFKDKINNEILSYVVLTLAILGFFILLYYGYLFITLYGVIVMRRNIGALFVILCFLFPVLFFVLMILGFLYGAGPLRQYLQDKMDLIKHE